MTLTLSDEDFAQLTDTDIQAINGRQAWLDRARTKQMPPPGDWTQLIWKAGRGFGKTASEIQWAWWEGWRTNHPIIIHAVSPTLGEINKVLFEGPAGFQAAVPAECLAGGSWEQAFNKTDHLLLLSNGTKIQGFGAQEAGGRLRGPQCHVAIGDELREWDRPAGNLEFVHSNLMFGVRLPMPDGSLGRACFGTTPKNIPYLKTLYKQRGVRVITGTTHENLPNLAKSFTDIILSKEGTKIGKQEIYAQDIDGDEEAIFKKRWIRLWPPNKKLPEFMFLLMSMDTAFEEDNFDPKGEKEPDYSACSVWGVFNTRQCFKADELKEYGVKAKYAALLCDFWMERYGFPELLEAARKTYRTKYGSPGRVPDLVLIENKASGISLRQTLVKYGVPTWPFNPRGQSKTMRAHAASPFVLQGMMFMPESRLEDRQGQVCDWAEPLLDQMTTFTGEGSIEYDDALDTCLGAETLVMTASGLQRIDTLQPGQMVMTHRGRWRQIERVSARVSDHHYRLKGKGLDELRVTGDHKVMAMSIKAPPRSAKLATGVDWKRVDELKQRGSYAFMRNGRSVQSKTRKAHDALVLPRCKMASDWRLDLKDFLPSDGFAGANEVWIKRARSRRTKRFIPMDYEAGWCMGLFAAEGSVSRPKRHNGRVAYITWACDEVACQRVSDWLTATFNRSVKVGRGSGAHRVMLGLSVIAPLFEAFGAGASNKMVPEFVYRANPAFISGFIDGIVHGDGHVQLRRPDEPQTALTSTSLSLLWGVKLLLARQGRYSTICISKQGGRRRVFDRDCDCLTAYMLNWSDGKRDWTAIHTADYQGLYVEKVEKIVEPLVVYDISVQEDHSFVTTGGVVHNCVQAMIHLSEKGYFNAEPQGRAYPDPDEKDDKEKAEAVRLAAAEKRRQQGNPYGQ